MANTVATVKRAIAGLLFTHIVGFAGAYPVTATADQRSGEERVDPRGKALPSKDDMDRKIMKLLGRHTKPRTTDGHRSHDDDAATHIKLPAGDTG